MSPNSGDDTHLLKPVANCNWIESDKPRPPLYNPEDYALFLKKFCRRSESQAPSIITLSSPQAGEMSLKEFGNVTDLLNKLKTDLKFALISFVQEFVGDPVDGVTLLLELLRSLQLTQASHMRVPPPVLRRCLLDEHSCLICLRSCLRCQDAPRRLASSPAGLFTLTVCIMSNVNKSRILALELLTKTCEQPSANGHTPVSDALSTMRLRFGEPVRFCFLVGILSGACPELLGAGLRFINTFIETAPSDQLRFYIQAELEQAGFIKALSVKGLLSDLVKEELSRWEKNYIDVVALKSRVEKSSAELKTLKDKILLLERRVQILQEEKSVLSSLEKCLKERCSELESELLSTQEHIPMQRDTSGTPAEDEGISSSDQDEVQREPLVYEMYNVKNDTIFVEKDEEETTIEEVMEELQNIINDAETDYAIKKDKNRELVNKEEITFALARLSTSEALILEEEMDIIPERLHPQPPKKSRSLFNSERDCNHNNIFFEDEDSIHNCDSLLSTLWEPTISHFSDNHYKAGCMVAERTTVRRRKTFNGNHTIQKPAMHQEILPEIKSRRNSIEGLFYVTEFADTPAVTTKPNTTTVYIDPKSDRKRLKSKSLDRIDDGLDSLVDIVLTSEEKPRYEPSVVIVTRSPADRSVFLPQRQRFVLKRGHTNAGLYSGQHNVGLHEYNRGLSISPGKFMDLPSGLY